VGRTGGRVKKKSMESHTGEAHTPPKQPQGECRDRNKGCWRGASLISSKNGASREKKGGSNLVRGISLFAESMLNKGGDGKETFSGPPAHCRRGYRKSSREK